ncbi:MAG: Flp family type IVb pilin [Methylophaga sp.]|jgi:pilus assembly protein Flp/PilA|nr:Flp family type IVb pilin [Methylophaga sp.]
MKLNVMTNAVMNFLRDEEGASGIEYALVAAMVAIGIVTFVTPVREAIVTVFTQIQTELGNVGGGS